MIDNNHVLVIEDDFDLLYMIKKLLEIRPTDDKEFHVNIDGSTMNCRHVVKFNIVDRIHLISSSEA